MLWDCVPGTLGGHLSQTCRFCVVTLPGLKMGVGGPGQTSRSHCAHFDLEFTRLHVCLSVCLQGFVLGFGAPPPGHPGSRRAAAPASGRLCLPTHLCFPAAWLSVRKRKPMARAPRQLGTRGGKPELSPCSLSLRTGDWSVKGEPRRWWLCCISRTNPRGCVQWTWQLEGTGGWLVLFFRGCAFACLFM